MSIMTANSVPMRTTMSIAHTYAQPLAAVLGLGLVACIVLAFSVQDLIIAVVVFAALAVTASAYAALGYVCTRMISQPVDSQR